MSWQQAELTAFPCDVRGGLPSERAFCTLPDDIERLDGRCGWLRAFCLQRESAGIWRSSVSLLLRCSARVKICCYVSTDGVGDVKEGSIPLGNRERCNYELSCLSSPYLSGE